MVYSYSYNRRIWDLYPVTVGGKIVASLLMIVGIAILGVLISTLGAALIETRFKKEKGRRIHYIDDD